MKLSDLYKTLDKASRTTLAENAGISPAYLWQIATQWSGRKPSIEVIGRLIRADSRLRAEDLVREFSSLPEPTPKESSHA